MISICGHLCLVPWLILGPIRSQMHIHKKHKPRRAVSRPQHRTQQALIRHIIRRKRGGAGLKGSLQRCNNCERSEAAWKAQPIWDLLIGCEEYQLCNQLIWADSEIGWPAENAAKLICINYSYAWLFVLSISTFPPSRPEGVAVRSVLRKLAVADWTRD